MFYVIRIEFEKAISEMLIWDFSHQLCFGAVHKKFCQLQFLNKSC